LGLTTRGTRSDRQILWIGERDFLTLNNQVSAADAKLTALARPINMEIGAFSATPLLILVSGLDRQQLLQPLTEFRQPSFRLTLTTECSPLD
jgi:hypothetical protein